MPHQKKKTIRLSTPFLPFPVVFPKNHRRPPSPPGTFREVQGPAQPIALTLNLRQALRKVNHFALLHLTQPRKRRRQPAFRPPEGRSFYAHLPTLGLQFLGTTWRGLSVD